MMLKRNILKPSQGANDVKMCRFETIQRIPVISDSLNPPSIDNLLDYIMELLRPCQQLDINLCFSPQMRQSMKEYHLQIHPHDLLMLASTVQFHFIKGTKYPCGRCWVCTKNNVRSETRYMCLQCKIFLCKSDSYTAYHSKKIYWK